MIKLNILSENRDNCNFKGESGLSVLIEAFNNSFLFDTGYSNLFIENAKLLNINLNNVNTVVLSHGHSDHTNGVQYLSNGKTIILHPQCFKDRWSIRKQEFVGFKINEQQLKQNHNVVLTTAPTKIFNNCYFLGEIPMIIDFESNGNSSTTLDSNLTQTDHTEDDSGVAITTKQGLVIFTGCGHRGVCNTIEHAKNITGQSTVYAIFGGFHLRKLEKQKKIIDKTIDYIKNNNIKIVYLGHCVTDDVIDYMEQHLPFTQIIRIAAGKQFELNVQPLN